MFIVSLTVTTPEGCEATATDSVLVCEPDIEEELFVPNIFSPNGDGLNDILYVRGEEFETFNMIIYSRWGQKVFESNDPTIGWDGTYQGEQLPADTYVYHVSGRQVGNATPVALSGNVTVLR